MRQVPFSVYTVDPSSIGLACYGRLQRCETKQRAKANSNVICLFTFDYSWGYMKLTTHLYFFITTLQLLTTEDVVIDIIKSNVIQFGRAAAPPKEKMSIRK